MDRFFSPLLVYDTIISMKFELTVWCFYSPILEINAGNSLAAKVLLRKVIWLYLLQFLVKAFVKQLFPIDQIDHVHK